MIEKLSAKTLSDVQIEYFSNLDFVEIIQSGFVKWALPFWDNPNTQSNSQTKDERVAQTKGTFGDLPYLIGLIRNSPTLRKIVDELNLSVALADILNGEVVWNLNGGQIQLTFDWEKEKVYLRVDRNSLIKIIQIIKNCNFGLKLKIDPHQVLNFVTELPTSGLNIFNILKKNSNFESDLISDLLHILHHADQATTTPTSKQPQMTDLQAEYEFRQIDLLIQQFRLLRLLLTNKMQKDQKLLTLKNSLAEMSLKYLNFIFGKDSPVDVSYNFKDIPKLILLFGPQILQSGILDGVEKVPLMSIIAGEVDIPSLAKMVIKTTKNENTGDSNGESKTVIEATTPISIAVEFLPYLGSIFDTFVKTLNYRLF